MTPAKEKVHAKYSTFERREWDATGDLSPIPACGQGLWFYLLTTQFMGVLPGLVMAGEYAMAEHLGWDIADFRKAFAELEATGRAKAHWKARLVVLPGEIAKAVARRPPESPNVVKGWRAQWLELPAGPLRDEYRAILIEVFSTLGEGYRLALADILGEAPPKTTSKPLPKGSPKPSAKASAKHDQDLDHKLDHEREDPPREGASTGGGGLPSSDPPAATTMPPGSPVVMTMRESSEFFRPAIQRGVDAGKDFARKMLAKIDECRTLSEDERSAILRMDRDIVGGAPAAAGLAPDELSSAYAAGIVRAAGAPWGGVAPKERIHLSTIASKHALGPAGVPLTGNKLKVWMVQTALDFRKATATTAQYQNGFQPGACLKWLDSGKASGDVSRPRTAAAEKHAATVQRGHADPGRAAVGTPAAIPDRIEDLRP